METRPFERLDRVLAAVAGVSAVALGLAAVTSVVEAFGSLVLAGQQLGLVEDVVLAVEPWAAAAGQSEVSRQKPEPLLR